MTAQIFLNGINGSKTNDTESVLPNGASANCVDGLTSTYWRQSGSLGEFTVDAGKLISPTYLLISNHNWNLPEYTLNSLTIWGYDTDEFLNPIVVVQLVEADIIAGTISKEIAPGFNFRYYKIFTNITADDFNYSGIKCGDITLSETIDLPEGIAPSYTPPHLAIKATIENNITMGGNFIGRSLTLEQYDFIIKQDNLSPDWVRANWLDLLRYIQAKPFYYLWDSDHPEDTVFCWTKGEIPPPIYDNQCFMSFSFDCNGFIENVGG